MPDRIIKESICTSDTLNRLTDFEERFWHRLTVNCDDYGRFDARPAILKSRLFPLMDGKTLKNMSDTLNRLASVGLVEIYEVDGKPFLQLVTWDKYQRIRAKRSKFPAPDGNCRQLTADVAVIQSESESNPNPNPKRESESKAFDVFWAAYPKKVAKEAARKAFEKVKVDISVLVTAVEEQRASPQWKKDNGQFIPNPATWLNQGRWEDEIKLETLDTSREDAPPGLDDRERMKKLRDRMRGCSECEFCDECDREDCRKQTGNTNGGKP